MAAISATLDTRQLNAALNGLKRASDVRPLLDRIGQIMVTDTQLNFKTERSPDGVPWEPLKPETVKRRRGGGGGAKILRDTSRLRNSITYAHLLGQHAVEIGTNVIYARAHQYGRPEINLPARPFIGIGDKQHAKINKAIEAWAESLLAK